MEELLCPWGPAKFLIFSENIPPLLYYSHFIAIIVALIVSIVVFISSRKEVTSKLLLLLFGLFSFWTFIDVIIWATNRTDMVMFWWSMQVLVEPLIYTVAFYLFYRFTYNKNPNFKTNLITGILLLPLIALTPTRFNLEGIYIDWCDAIEHPFIIYYTYILEGLFIIAIIAITIHGIKKLKTKTEKIRIFYFALGLIAFLVAFTSGNIIGSVTGDWDLAQYGLFGMPIFIGILAYLIVQYKVFNLKIFGAQALVVALWVLIGSLLFVVQSPISRIVALITLSISVIFGLLLIKSVKREIEQKEEIEKLAKKLEEANEHQVALIHFITHQIKGFLTKSRNIFAELREANDSVSEEFKDMVKEGFSSDTKAVETVQNILKASNIKMGTVKYEKKPVDIKELIKKESEGLRKNAEAKGLEFNVQLSDEECKVTGDKDQLIHAIKNLIDNSIKYTLKGSINISLSKEEGKVRFSIKDTGVGIDEEDKKHLFTEGGRGRNSLRTNTESTGYGLYIVKNIIESHGGKIWAESEGEGKGTAFIVELDSTE